MRHIGLFIVKTIFYTFSFLIIKIISSQRSKEISEIPEVSDETESCADSCRKNSENQEANQRED